MNVNKMVKSAMLIALGVILPQIFHLMGGAGTIFLPIYYPAILAGFLVGKYYGTLVAILVPICSHFITGMPPVSPLPIMFFLIFELTATAFTIGLMHYNFKQHIIVSLLVGLVSARVVGGILIYIFALLFQIKGFNAILYVYGAIIAGIPGILLHVFATPALLKIFALGGYFDEHARN